MMPWATFMTISESFIIVNRFAFSDIENSRACVTKPNSVMLSRREVMKIPLIVRMNRKYGSFSNDHSIRDKIFLTGFTFGFSSCASCASSSWLTGAYWGRGLIRAAPVTVVTVQMAAYTRITFCVESSRSVTRILMTWGRTRPSTLMAAVQRAMAIGMAAIGVEGLILPQVIKILVTDLELSTQNVILVYAAICAVTTVTGAALMRPLPQFAPVNQDDETKAAAEDEKEKVNPVKKILSLIEWSLLKQPYFLFILTINGIFMTSLLLSITELGFVTQAREFSISEKANLFTIMNASDIVMKLAQGMIADLQFIKRTFKYPMKFLYRFNAVGMAILMLGAGMVDSFAELATVAAIATFFNANVMMNFSQILRWPFI